MSDGSTFQIGLDSSKSRAELKRFEQAIDRVGTSIQKLGASGGGFDKLAAQVASAASGFEKLKSLAGLQSATKDIAAMSRTLGSFRAPNAATIANITNLGRALNTLSRVNMPRGLGQSLSSLTAGLANLHVPDMQTINRIPALLTTLAKASAVSVNPRTGAELKFFADGLRSVASIPLANVQRLPAALAALDRIKVNASTATGLAGLGSALQGIGTFRIPTAGNVTNLQRMLIALESANVDRIRSLATALHGLSLPVTRTISQASQPARAPAPSASTFALPNASGSSYSNATQGIQSIRTAADSARSAVALLGAALGGLTVGKLARDIYDAGSSLLTMKRSLDVVATSATEAGEHWDFLKNLVNQTGTSLTTAIPAYTQLATAMRGLGLSVSDTQTTFSGFAKYFAVMGTPIADQKRALLELREVYSMESGKAAQVLRGMTTHMGTLMSDIARVMQKTSKEVHDMFHDGGIPPEVFTKLGAYYDRVYSQQLPAALQHSQTQLGRFSNAWFELKEKVFSSGFDTGPAASLSRLTGSLEKLTGSDIATKLGASFSSAFQNIATAGALASRHAEGFTKLAVAVGAVATASVAMMVIGTVVSPLAAAATAAGRLSLALVGLSAPVAIPLLAGAAALVALVASSDSAEEALQKLGRTWDFVKDGFSNFATAIAPSVSATFSSMAEDGQKLVNVAKEAILYWQELQAWRANGYQQAPDWREQYAKRRADLDNMFGSSSTSSAASGSSAGDAFGKSLTTTLAKLQAAVGPALKGLVSAIGGDLMKEWQEEQKRTADAVAKASAEIKTQNQYAENAANALEKQRRAATELSDSQKTLLDKLQSSNAALVELRKNLETIDSMQGRKDGLGNVIDAARIAKLKEAAKLQALPQIDPSADLIRRMTEEVSIKSRFAGDKDAVSDETRVLEARNAALKAGTDLTARQEQALRALLKANRELDSGGSNPFAKWAAGVKSDSEMLADTVKSSLDDISTKLSDLVVNGKGQFKSLGAAIRATFASILGNISKKLIKNSIDSLLRDGIKSLSGMFGDSGKGILSAISGGKSVVSDALSGMSDKTVASMNVTAANVVINGGIGSIGTPAASAFTANGPAGGSTMGGLSPQSIVGPANPPLNSISPGLSMFGGQTPASLMSSGSSSLSAVMSAVKSGNIIVPNVTTALGKAGAPLGNIGGSGLSAFGTGISPIRAPGEISLGFGGAGQSSGTIGSGGFAGYTKLVPIVPRSSGIGKLGGGSSLAAFSGQSPSAFITGRTATDNLARAGVAPTGLTRPFVPGDNSQAAVEAYIRQSATARGINPDIAARGFKQESQFRYNAKNINAREESYGPTQLNMKGGLGQEALKAGVNPRDPSQWREQVDWSMDYAKQHSWKAWYGFRDSGVKNPWEGIPRNGQRAGLDMNPTGSIANQSQAASQEFKVGDDLSKSLLQSVKQTTPEITQNLQKAFGSGNGASGELGQFASKITETGSAASSAEGGLGSLIQKLSSLGGMGGGGMFGGGGGLGEMFAGAFSEGGYVDSPVSMASLPTSYWQGAPRFAEGGVTDGIPILAHPQEAIIPLSRNRSIPVELRGDDRGGGNTIVNNHMSMNVKAQDENSFRRNAHQTAVALQNMLGRAAARSA